MTVQAAGARRVIDRDPARAAEAIAAVESSGRTALLELRRLLAGLTPDGVRDALEVQPSLEQLPSLIRRVNRSGVHADLHIVGEPFPLPANVDFSAYRIVQEALTNVIKHADDGDAQVIVRYGDGALGLVIENDGRGGCRNSARDSNGGAGLIGMRERAALLGGSLEAVALVNGGYRVQATLPVAR
jgi:signal transduction histidine kinase